jgi:hypothetical protein
MKLRDGFGRMAAASVICVAFGATAIASATAGTAFEDGAVVQMASLRDANSIRSVGGASSFTSLDKVCSDIMRDVARKVVKAGINHPSTKELTRLMKGMRCVE